jgi:hypothetical protein
MSPVDEQSPDTPSAARSGHPVDRGGANAETNGRQPSGDAPSDHAQRAIGGSSRAADGAAGNHAAAGHHAAGTDGYDPARLAALAAGAGDRSHALDAAVAGLPYDERRVIDLYLHGHSSADIAAAVGVSEATVMDRLVAALAKVRRVLRERFPAAGAPLWFSCLLLHDLFH